MTAERIQEFMHNAPFQPFDIRTSDGRVYTVDHPDFIARSRDGKTLTTDGPFAETHEQLAGYYQVEAQDLDAALAIAARIPGAKVGSIEVRPIWVYQ